MLNSGSARLRVRFAFLSLLMFMPYAGAPAAAPAQSPSAHTYYARVNTLGVLGAYSWDSSHILLGDAERRKLVNIGVSYSRRLFLNHVVNWQYDGEFLPLALEGDPLSGNTVNQTEPTVTTITDNNGGGTPVTCAPRAASYSFTDSVSGVTYSGTVISYCTGRQWTIGEATSPIGLRWNFLPSRKVQPFIDGHGGYMYSTQPIPVYGSGSFNFTLDIGAGIEIYRSHSASIRAEYRYHHISNHNTANQNPGIDSGLLQVTYCFRLGRQ